MTINFSADLATAFATGDGGASGTYTPLATGTPQAVNVLASMPDEAFTGLGVSVRTKTANFLLMASDVAAPAKGDTLLVNAVTYVVQAYEYDDGQRLLWRLDCKVQ